MMKLIFAMLIACTLSACSSLASAFVPDSPGAAKHAFCGEPAQECRAPFFHKLDQA